MIEPVYNRLSKEDITICRAFMAIVKQGKFEIKGEALQQCGALFKWASDLEKRIELSITPIVFDEPKKTEEKNKK